MAKKPITPGQKAAKARDRERFAAKLADNEAEADRVYERLLDGDWLAVRADGSYASQGGDHVAPAIVSILLHRGTAILQANAVIPAMPPDE